MKAIARPWLVAPTLGQGLCPGGADVALCVAFVGVLGYGVSRSARVPPAELDEEGADA